MQLLILGRIISASLTSPLSVPTSVSCPFARTKNLSIPCSAARPPTCLCVNLTNHIFACHRIQPDGESGLLPRTRCDDDFPPTRPTVATLLRPFFFRPPVPLFRTRSCFSSRAVGIRDSIYLLLRVVDWIELDRQLLCCAVCALPVPRGESFVYSLARGWLLQLISPPSLLPVSGHLCSQRAATIAITTPPHHDGDIRPPTPRLSIISSFIASLGALVPFFLLLKDSYFDLYSRLAQASSVL